MFVLIKILNKGVRPSVDPKEERLIAVREKQRVEAILAPTCLAHE
jgi:hypothetical protein